MQILNKKINKENLLNLSTIGENHDYFDYMIKIVVDIEKEELAINAEMHYELENLLLSNGSDNKNLYGANILLDNFEIEFDSIINAPRNRDDGYPRECRYVSDPEKRNKIIQVVNKWIEM